MIVGYENNRVSESQVIEAHKRVETDPKNPKNFGRFKTYLALANLHSWQLQGYHWNYASVEGNKLCTCGLLIMGHENRSKIPFKTSSYISLDEVQSHSGHRNLPSCRGRAVALIVNVEYEEKIRKSLSSAICQNCEFYIESVGFEEAQSFVTKHNKSCR